LAPFANPMMNAKFPLFAVQRINVCQVAYATTARNKAQISVITTLNAYLVVAIRNSAVIS